MEIKRAYFQKYIDKVAIEQIADEYRNKGYHISTEEKIGTHYADLVARKNEETIVIEVKSGKMSPEKRKAIVEIGNYVKSAGNYKFLVVMVTPPQKKKLEVHNIHQLLAKYIIDTPPQELLTLSAKTSIEGVADITVDELTVRADGTIFVKGNGVIAVKLQYGSALDMRTDIGETSEDNFPFDFEVVLQQNNNKELSIAKVQKLYVDTSSY
jgi:Holliday junction resolvase